MTVAVIGIACRFPGAPGKSELWDLLMSGEAVADRPAAGPPPFDRAAFGVSEAEARRLDARQRLLLHCGWHAAEDAGMDPAALGSAPTGLYLGLAEPPAAASARHANQDTATPDGPKPGTPEPGGPAFEAPEPGGSSGGDALVERVARHLDLRGPAVGVLGGGPAALVAVHLACSAVLRRECDYALAGGVDASGAGGGLVMLRRLDDALSEGRSVYAVVRGGAVGGHGRGEPFGPQAWRRRREVLATAYRRAGVMPAEIAFAEVAPGSPAQGGRRLADAPELRALAALHDVPRERPCGVGTIAGGLGEPGGAAGIAAVIKAALALHHRVVPPSGHTTPPAETGRAEPGRAETGRGEAGHDAPPAGHGPVVEDGLDGTGLRVLDAYQRLPSDQEVACGVGGGTRSGTIAHLVLSMVRPLPDGPMRPETPVRGGVFTLSAPDHAGLARNLRAQAGALAACRPDELGAICYTSNKVKNSLLHRFVTVVPSLPDLLERLHSAAADPSVLAELSGVRREGLRYGLVLPDLDAWPAGAQIELGAGPAAFHDSLDEAATEVFVQEELRDLDDDARQPTLVEVMECVDSAVAFCVAYAFGRMLMALGPRPVFVAGCGVGAVAAHCLAGSVSLDDAARAVTGRAPLVPSAAAALPVLAVAEPDEAHLGSGSGLPDLTPLDEVTHLVSAGPAGAFAHALKLRLGGSGPGPRLLAAAGDDAVVDPLELVAVLAREGFDLDWDALYPPRQRTLHRLAPYEFARPPVPPGRPFD